MNVGRVLPWLKSKNWGLTSRPPRVGLALSGGAIRGLAHLGVVEVLLAAGIEFSAVCGTSAGSIVGALVAARVPVGRLRELGESVTWGQLTRWMLPGHMGLLSLEPLEALLEEEIRAKTFADLSIPFACAVFDVEQEELLILKEGPLARAVRASCAVPGIFTPVEWNGRLLVDGGVVNNLPVRPLLDMGAEYIIAVDLFPPRREPRRPPHTLALLEVAFYNMIRANSHERALAHVLIEPDIRDASFWNFAERDAIVDAGRRAAQAVLPRILADLGLPNI